jgi:glutathione S-transferase
LGRGRAETTRWMLAFNQIDFLNIPIKTPEELSLLRASGKLPFDQMPLLEIDGNYLSQSSAMIRYLARLGNLYGSDDNEALLCDMFAGAIADFAETSMQAAFQPSQEIAIHMLKNRFSKFGPKFESKIKENGLTFCVGKKISFVDILLTEALNAYIEWIPNLLDKYPFLNSLYIHTMNQPGIKKYLSSEQRYPKPNQNYVIDVARVLERALPDHMEDVNRFVK